MEGLTISDLQTHLRYRSASRSSEMRRRASHQPTLGALQSINDAVEAFGTMQPAHERPVFHDLRLRVSTDSKSETSSVYSHCHRQRYDDCNPPAPHSPPYSAADDEKTSLPPLKTVLGDAISSPPHTPSGSSVCMQPSPREPTYTTSTYKPPSLYPNKKARIEPPIEYIAPVTTASSFRSPGLPAITFDARSQSDRTRLDSPLSKLHSSADTVDRCRAPLQHHGTYHSVPMSSCMVHHYPLPIQHTTLATDHSAGTQLHHSYRPPEGTLTSRSFAWGASAVRGFDGPAHAGAGYERLPCVPQNNPTALRRSSVDAKGSSLNRGAEAKHASHSSSQNGFQYPFTNADEYNAHEDSIRFGRRAMYPPLTVQGLTFGNCDNSPPGFFVPSQYEHQHGKTRKRSNLPKQSTEIMKLWFDQNVMNPYPSEEQKAVFSSATGISMTQVSNWFINHRRRCPELRDKRERNRNGAREAEP